MVMTSTSTSGSAEPSTSRPTWWCWRNRPAWTFSYRNAGVAYQTFHGDAGWCCTNARTTDAVPSGRRAMRRPPLSSKSYISLRTASAPSDSRWKTPISSNIGDWSSPYPARSTVVA